MEAFFKDIWVKLPEHTGKPMPPLGDKMLAELGKESAVIEGEFGSS